MPPFIDNVEYMAGPASWDPLRFDDTAPSGSQDFLHDLDEDMAAAPMINYGADQLHDSGIIEDDPAGLFQDIPAPHPEQPRSPLDPLGGLEQDLYQHDEG